jgi:dTDP-4-amino-4,6-dideoxygalactose transaminase
MTYTIPFNVPEAVGPYKKYIRSVMANRAYSGDGEFSRQCCEWLEKNLACRSAVLAPSCTHALEMAALLAGIGPGDEVIMPSFTFTSTANAFAIRGARIVFVDIRPDTMNIDERLIEAAVTARTRAVCAVHYGGVACDMDALMKIAARHSLLVIEDAAHAILGRYRGRCLGTIGDLGCLSFHETKNVQCGEGGALLINNASFIERAHVIRDKGTNRREFLLGRTDRYVWTDIGSSVLCPEVVAAFLLAQMESAYRLNESRKRRWEDYYRALSGAGTGGPVGLPVIPEGCEHNGHLFYVKAKDYSERTTLLEFLRKRGIDAIFHYVPLHSAPAGKKLGEFCGEDRFTTRESERLLRLPLWYGLKKSHCTAVVRALRDFYGR